MTTDIVFTTVNLPPAYLGQVYECAIAYKGNTTSVSAQSVGTSVNGSGLPAGLALDTSNLGSVRITGTPTGVASTAISSGTALSGVGAYTFTVKVTDAAGAVNSSNYTINVYSEYDYLLANEYDQPGGPNSNVSVADQVSQRGF